MFQLLSSKLQSMLGIDLRPYSLKILELSSVRNKICLEQYAIQSLPQATEAFSAYHFEAVHNLLKQAAFKSRQAAIALPDSMILTKTVQIPAELVPQNVAEFVKLHAEHFAYPLDELNLDFELLSPHPNNRALIDLLIVATRAQQVQALATAFKEIDLSLQIVDVASFALQRAAHHGFGAVVFHEQVDELALRNEASDFMLAYGLALRVLQ